MKKLSAELLILTTAVLFTLICAMIYPIPASATFPPQTAHSAANGQRIFTQSCSSCHDVHSTAPKVGIGLKGYYRQHQPRPTDASVRAIILKGKGNMPGFSIFSGPQIDDLIAYLRTL